MDVIDQFKQDVREGRIDVNRLIDVIVTLQRQLETAQRELEAAKHRIEELERKAGGSATAKCNEPFSKCGRRGRLTTLDKVKLAERTEKCFPEGTPAQDCHHSHTRPGS